MRILFLSLFLVGCDSWIAQVTAVGSSADITCYSGTQVIYKGKSTGKVATESQSDGWYFKDAATGKLVRISGSCVIIN